MILKPEHERLIQAQIASGKFPNPEAVIEAALDLLEQSSSHYTEWLEETRQKIDVAIAQVERGEVLDGETVIAQLQAKLHQGYEM